MGSFVRGLFSMTSQLLGSGRFFPTVLNSTRRLTLLGNEISLLFPKTISTSAVLLAEPLKKKKKMDPAVIRAREERKRRKLQKQIRRLEKHQRQLKPLDELEIPISIVDAPGTRERKLPQLPTEVIDSRWRLVKEWGIYKKRQVDAEYLFFRKIKQSQERALQELQMESESLYIAATKIDPDFIPYEVKGPAETPPIQNYISPDGDYIDTSRKWE